MIWTLINIPTYLLIYLLTYLRIILRASVRDLLAFCSFACGSNRLVFCVCFYIYLVTDCTHIIIIIIIIIMPN